MLFKTLYNSITQNNLPYFIIHIILIFLYILLFIFSINFIEQKTIIYIPLFLGIVSRLLSFSLFILYKEGIIQLKYFGEVLFINITFSTLFFLSFISSLSFFLLKIYIQGFGNKKINLYSYKLALIMINVVVYTLVSIIISYELIFSIKEMISFQIPYSKAQKVIQLFFALIYISISFFFLFIGKLYSFFEVVRDINRDSGYHRNIFTQFKYTYGLLIIFGVIFFFFRTILTVTSVFTQIDHHGIFEIIFHSIFEILPTILILLISKKLNNDSKELEYSNDQPDILSPIFSKI
ncbi:hypothetical protein RB653_006448 [Dictyostelium firmibasis]|uniref:Uncharacterized protein n=1 Tax=Dictyostelium firmibasis TaxID=79012 RepID=A0AAN7UB92_9MYCE